MSNSPNCTGFSGFLHAGGRTELFIKNESGKRKNANFFIPLGIFFHKTLDNICKFSYNQSSVYLDLWWLGEIFWRLLASLDANKFRHCFSKVWQRRRNFFSVAYCERNVRGDITLESALRCFFRMVVQCSCAVGECCAATGRWRVVRIHVIWGVMFTELWYDTNCSSSILPRVQLSVPYISVRTNKTSHKKSKTTNSLIHNS